MTKTEQLRELVISAESKGIELLEIAAAAKVGYQRLRRIVKYDYDPTLEEADRIQSAVVALALKKGNELRQLAAV